MGRQGWGGEVSLCLVKCIVYIGEVNIMQFS